MQTKFLIIIGVIIAVGIVFMLSFSIEKEESYVLLCNHWFYSDHKTCKPLWRYQQPSEQTDMINTGLIAVPSPREFLRMECEDLYMYQEPPSQDVIDAWNTRMYECQNNQEKLPVLIELERWRQISCKDILNNTMPKFENLVSQQAFDIRNNQCMEIMESKIDESKNEN